MTERWTMRRGTKAEDKYAPPSEQCMLIDAKGNGTPHASFARVIVRMDVEREDRKELMKRAELIVLAPELRDFVELVEATTSRMADPTAFVTANKIYSLRDKARELLEKLK